MTRATTKFCFALKFGSPRIGHTRVKSFFYHTIVHCLIWRSQEGWLFNDVPLEKKHSQNHFQLSRMININKQTNNLRNKKNGESLAQYLIELKLLPVGLREIKKGCNPN